MAREPLKVGDRVETGSGDDYDIGAIVGFTFDRARVHWDLSQEVYTEDPRELRLVAAKGDR